MKREASYGVGGVQDERSFTSRNLCAISYETESR